MKILMCSGFEVGRMRKGHNPTAALRKGHNPTAALIHRIYPTVTRNIPNIVRPKQCVPRETMPYPDM
jgi:hypothetical protein